MLWLTAIVLALLVGASLTFGDWHITLGLLLGGVLSFLNLYWLKISVESLLGKAVEGKRPRFIGAFFVLRYVIIGLTIAAAVSFNLVSVAATMIGLLSFAFAILLESFIQVYLLIVNREED